MGREESATPRTNRKVYTISKPREKWTDEEHTAFLEALKKRGRNWKALVDDIGTRTVAQVRSHAQKYFLRLEKEGHEDQIPPPRPKKRAARPYPVQAKDTESSQPALKAKKAKAGSSPVLQVSSPTNPGSSHAGHSQQPSSPSQPAATAGVSAGGLSAADNPIADANFSKLYAIVGSMFENSVSVPQQLSTIEHLPAEQKEPLLLMLSHLCANLRQTVSSQQQTPSVLPPPQPLQWQQSLLAPPLQPPQTVQPSQSA